MSEGTSWEHWKFGIIVTGKGEQKRIERLFRSVSATGLCSFQVIGLIDQLSPIESPTRKVKIVGTGGAALPKDTEKIGVPARKYIQNGTRRFVIVIDDLEWDRRDVADGVFARYRDALDSVLRDDYKSKAAVHFLAMMMEAYFFADSQAVNTVLKLELSDHEGDVESIRNPKSELRNFFPEYNEIEHGAEILGRLRAEYILSRVETCAYLRSLFAWCIEKLNDHPQVENIVFPDFNLNSGVVAPATHSQ